MDLNTPKLLTLERNYRRETDKTKADLIKKEIDNLTGETQIKQKKAELSAWREKAKKAQRVAGATPEEVVKANNLEKYFKTDADSGELLLTKDGARAIMAKLGFITLAKK